MVTFWASDFFVSEEGYRVKQGQTLRTEIVRQVSVDEASYVKTFSNFMGYFVLASIFLGFFIALYLDADTVPFWSLYDVISLLSHLPLANVGMPG